MLPPETEQMCVTCCKRSCSKRNRMTPTWNKVARYPPPDKVSAIFTIFSKHTANPPNRFGGKKTGFTIVFSQCLDRNGRDAVHAGLETAPHQEAKKCVALLKSRTQTKPQFPLLHWVCLGLPACNT